ncbi:MAG: NUDIX domain-containing protein [Nanoarchaeota archaeon]|nr:NUDIX domain-containing protein [Nanoarchaeota archaeon]
MKYEESAGVVIYCIDNEQTKFLLLKYPSYWGFSKGLIEEGESEKETALRELEEETGIPNVEIIPNFEFRQNWFFKHQGNIIRKSAVYFLSKVENKFIDKIKLSPEHTDFKWLNFDNAIKKIEIKQNKEMLKKAYDFLKEKGDN